jgi:hypothetical protein
MTLGPVGKGGKDCAPPACAVCRFDFRQHM